MMDNPFTRPVEILPIDSHGFLRHGEKVFDLVFEAHVPICKSFLDCCREVAIKDIGSKGCLASELTRLIESISGRQITTGAVIRAAVEMGLEVDPRGRDALIGIEVRSRCVLVRLYDRQFYRR